MRMWYGIDREHNPSYGLMTLFVESDNPDIDIIVKVLSECNVGIDCVYFGAGEVDILNWEFLNELYKISDAFKVGVESSEPVPAYFGKYFDFVILRLPVFYVSRNVYIKYRSDTSVGICNAVNFTNNSLEDLKDGKYSCDVEVYNDEENL